MPNGNMAEGQLPLMYQNPYPRYNHNVPFGQHPPQGPPAPNGHYPEPSPAHSNHSLPSQHGPVNPHPPHSMYAAAPPAQYFDPVSHMPQQQMYMPPPGPNGPYPGQPPQQSGYPPMQGYAPPNMYYGGGPGQYFPTYPDRAGEQGPGPISMQTHNNRYPQGLYMPRQPVAPMNGQQGYQAVPQQNGHDGMNHSHFGQPPPPDERQFNHPSQPPRQYGPPDMNFNPNYQQPMYAPPPQPYPPSGHPYAQGMGYGYPPPPMPSGLVPNGQMYNGNGQGYGQPHPPHDAPAPTQNQPPPPKKAGLNAGAREFTFTLNSSRQATPQNVNDAPESTTPRASAMHSISQSHETTTEPSAQANGHVTDHNATPRARSPGHGAANGDVLGLSGMQSTSPDAESAAPVPASAPMGNAPSSHSRQSSDQLNGSSREQSRLATPPEEDVRLASQWAHVKRQSGVVLGARSAYSVQVEPASSPATSSVRIAPRQIRYDPVSSSLDNDNTPSIRFGTAETDEEYVPLGTQDPPPPTDAPVNTRLSSGTTTPVNDQFYTGKGSNADALKFMAETDTKWVSPSIPIPMVNDTYIGVILVVTRRPAHDKIAVNTYDKKSLITKNMESPEAREVVVHYEKKSDPVQRTARKPRGFQIKGEDTGFGFDFGDMTSDMMATALATPAPQVKTEVTPPTPVAQPTAPKAKPVSWAALVGGGRSIAPVDTLSTGPSSIRASPSKSVVSLDHDAQSDLETVTPKSAAQALPPTSTGSAKKGPRPAINYAAAAAASKLSPQEDLVKLLTEGMRGRQREPLPLNNPRGLVNTGNMCFANTVLVYCLPFSELCEELGKRLQADLARRTPLLEAMLVFLREFRTSATSGATSPSGKGKPNGPAWKGKGKDKKYTANAPFIPEHVYNAMKETKRFESLTGGHQEDAEEFLGFFIETLHEELLQLVSRTESARASSTSQPQDIGDAVEIGRPSSPSDGWLEVGKKQKTNVVRATTVKESAVSRIFGGTLRSVLHVPGQKDSVTLESYQPLQLDIQSPTVKSIVDALKKLNEPEKFDYRSEVRNCNVEATKQVFIESFPPVLILHLKRFVFDPQARDVKTNKPVAYASELIIPSEIISPAQRTATPVKYRLFGVDYHHGASASGGHYTVAVARQDAKGWIHFDDETHSTIAEEDVVVSQDEAESGKVGLVGGREKCAYLLFYQRVR